MKGRVMPFVGNKFILVEIFIIVWKIKILPKPKVELRTKKLLALLQIIKILQLLKLQLKWKNHRVEISANPMSRLKRTETIVKSKLPTKEDIAAEK